MLGVNSQQSSCIFLYSLLCYVQNDKKKRKKKRVLPNSPSISGMSHMLDRVKPSFESQFFINFKIQITENIDIN